MYDYFQGFLLTTILLGIEHITLYARLRPRGDSGDTWRVLLKFLLGVGAILAGCAVTRFAHPTADPLLTPLACSAGGLVIIAGYIVRWVGERMIRSAETRGWLKGLADRADIAEGDDDGA